MRARSDDDDDVAALDADLADPWRVVYWSAVYVAREAARIEREYLKLLVRLKLYRRGIAVE